MNAGFIKNAGKRRLGSLGGADEQAFGHRVVADEVDLDAPPKKQVAEEPGLVGRVVHPAQQSEFSALLKEGTIRRFPGGWDVS